MDIKTYCSLLPKIELHAHLNGSMSYQALEKLQNLKYLDDPKAAVTDPINIADFKIENGQTRTLSQCLAAFGIAQSLTDSPKAVKLATLLTLEEFAKDNVIYLELRSTPRENENMTKTQYIQAMVDAVIESSSYLDMKTGLLVSIDRRNTIAQAKDTVDVAIEMHKKYPHIVLGLDLSGDPRINDFDDFSDLMKEGRKVGLKVTIHTAEVENDEETINILEWAPDRIGHATCIPDLLWDMLLESKTPIEICLTSNIKCEVVKSYNQHHFERLYKAGHPLCLATDDKGVFSTSLSEEYAICAETFKLTKEQMYEMALNTCNYIFASDTVKQELRNEYEAWSHESKETA